MKLFTEASPLLYSETYSRKLFDT